MAKNTLKALLEAGEFIAAPRVFDLVSAKIAGLTDAKALYMTGFGTVASYLGYPDAGLATYTDMLSRATAIAQAVAKLLIADGDTGYGDLLNVYHTVRDTSRQIMGGLASGKTKPKTTVIDASPSQGTPHSFEPGGKKAIRSGKP